MNTIKRKLVASLACRVKSTRLYGKPLQFLDIAKEWSVLGYIIDSLRTLPVIDEVVVAISSAPGNEPFREIADSYGAPWILGAEDDVLKRHLDAAEHVGATDSFVITSESPFLYFERVASARQIHFTHGNDVTAVDQVPDGCGFSIFSIASLRRSYDQGKASHRSEVSLFIRENPRLFKVETLDVEDELRRPDIRLTIDYPEDLTLCRKVYEHFKASAPTIPVKDIIEYLDANPYLKDLVADYVANPSLYQDRIQG